MTKQECGGWLSKTTSIEEDRQAAYKACDMLDRAMALLSDKQFWQYLTPRWRGQRDALLREWQGKYEDK